MPRATVFSYWDLRLHKSFEPERRVPTNPIKQALAMTQLLEAPEIRSKADIAKRLGISRARVTQTINLLKLAPEIRKHVLSLSDEEAAFFTERRLRPLTQVSSREAQLEAFHELA
jgi:ParB-like chromosome segregation protein Spo0J